MWNRLAYETAAWAGTKDWKLIEYIVANDYTLVTNNSVDFRGSGPGNLGGEHAKQSIHAGLVCLNSVHGLDLILQRELFQTALAELSNKDDLVNQALEVSEGEDRSFSVVVYDIPEPR